MLQPTMFVYWNSSQVQTDSRFWRRKDKNAVKMKCIGLLRAMYSTDTVGFVQMLRLAKYTDDLYLAFIFKREALPILTTRKKSETQQFDHKRQWHEQIQ